MAIKEKTKDVITEAPKSTFTKQRRLPRVASLVLFYTGDHNKWFNSVDAGPYPAIVTQVLSSEPGYETMVNLKVLHWGGEYDISSVFEREQGVAHGLQHPFWCWPE